jgi:hypothetical protein
MLKSWSLLPLCRPTCTKERQILGTRSTHQITRHRAADSYPLSPEIFAVMKHVGSSPHVKKLFADQFMIRITTKPINSTDCTFNHWYTFHLYVPSDLWWLHNVDVGCYGRFEDKR